MTLFQAMFDLHFINNVRKHLTLFVPHCSSNPRYFPILHSLWMPNMFLILVLVIFLFVFLVNKKNIFQIFLGVFFQYTFLNLDMMTINLNIYMNVFFNVGLTKTIYYSWSMWQSLFCTCEQICWMYCLSVTRYSVHLLINVGLYCFYCMLMTLVYFSSETRLNASWLLIL